jgi:hypothetical protein
MACSEHIAVLQQQQHVDVSCPSGSSGTLPPEPCIHHHLAALLPPRAAVPVLNAHHGISHALVVPPLVHWESAVRLQQQQQQPH